MKTNLSWLKILVGLAGLLTAVGATADGYVRIGNGDDGSDLEGLSPVKSGPLHTSREKAVTLLEKLGVNGVTGLGALTSEVKNTALFSAKADVVSSLKIDRSNFHSDVTGKVFARTLAQPYADTRFFPIAQKLEADQLVALHIHEGLHRSLPVGAREDENAVSEITLAITSPSATQDQIRAVVAKFLRADDIKYLAPSGGLSQAPSFNRTYLEERFSRPSNVGYSVTQFWRGSVPSLYSVTRMHTVNSDLYPFGGADTPFGLGLQAAVLEGSKGVKMGPFGISARLRVWGQRDFDFGLWSTASLNVLSNEEMKQSPFGRDIFTFGVSMRKTVESFYVENFLSVSLGSNSHQRIGLVDYSYYFGNSLNAKLRAGARTLGLEIGGYLELFLVDNFQVVSSSINENTGRYRILSVGPEASARFDTVTVSLFGRLLVDASQSVNFDYLGNLLNTGASQGSVGAAVRMEF